METANFIVASAGPDLPGLQVIEFDPQRCELRNGSFRPANGLPVYVVSNQGKAFVCLKSGDIAGYSDGIMVFEQSRDPQLITEFRAPGHYYVHLAVHPNGKLIAAADYHGGKVSLFSFDDDGLKLTSSIHHEGSGPNVERQQSAHPHWVGFTPDLRFLLAADLGADLVRVYDYQNGELTELPERNIRITAGAGPRHAIFSADGRMFYLVNELENSVMVFEYHAGEFTLRQTLPTLPPDTTDWSLAAAIRISDSGRSLLVTNRFVDGIFYCGIDQETGLLNHIATVACGRYPGDLVVFDNQQVLVAARDDDRVELYLLDEVAQTLQPTQTAIEIPQPKSIGPNFHAEIVMALKPEASSLTITRANDSDFESLATTSTEAFDSDVEVGGSGPGGPPGYDSASWLRRMARRSDVWRIEHNGELIGGVIVFRQGTKATLGRIWIAPQRQRQGLGLEAMRQIEAAYPDVTRWELDTPDWNTRTARFYPKAGYAVTSHRGDTVFYQKRT